MTKETHVLLIEDDFFALSLMELLLRRDWRTKVVGEVCSPVELSGVLKEINRHNGRIDLIIIDTDIPCDSNWLPTVLASLVKHSPQSKILLTSVEPNLQAANLQTHPNFAGYVLKGEICFSMAWAVSLASEHCVVTPGVRNMLEKTTPLPSGTMILDGRKPIAVVGLSEMDVDRSRMAIIFSMERNEFSNEEGISEDYSYGVVSALYEKIGLIDLIKDFLQGGTELDNYFHNYPAVMAHLKKTCEHLADTKSKKGKELETLAFHLITQPEIEEIT